MEEWLNTLVHGVALAAVAWAAARPRLFDARWRGRIWGAALVGLAALTAIHAVGGDVTALLAVRPEAVGGFAGGAAEIVPGTAGGGWIRIPVVAIPAALLAAAWALVALSRLLVLAVAVARIRAARAASRPFPARGSAQLPEWTAANRERFPLVVSDRVSAPSMLGFGRPMIAVPAGWERRLSDEALDAVLIHELAHAERRDDLFELAQQLVLAACWFHPAAWWIARRIAFEREAACDERAARLTTTRRYARSLVAIAEALQAAGARPRMLVASSGARGRQLTRRIRRLLGIDTRSALAHGSALAAPVLASIVALAAGAPMLPRVFDAADAVQGAPAMERQPVALPSSQATEQTRVEGRAGVRAIREAAGRGARLAPAGEAPAMRSAAPVREAQPDPMAEGRAVALEASLSSRDLSAHVLPSAVVPPAGASSAAIQSDNVEGRTGPSAPFRALGSAFARAGAGTGRWFSRAGTSVASAVTPR